MSAHEDQDNDDNCEICLEAADLTYHCTRCDIVHCESHTVFLDNYYVDCADPLCRCCAIALIADLRARETEAHRQIMLNLARAEKHCYSLFE